jgi:hypothetical protein
VFTDPPYNVPIDGHVCGLPAASCLLTHIRTRLALALFEMTCNLDHLTSDVIRAALFPLHDRARLEPA